MNSEEELKEIILNAVIKHRDKTNKVLSSLRIHWTKINGEQCVSGLTVKYKPLSK